MRTQAYPAFAPACRTRVCSVRSYRFHVYTSFRRLLATCRNIWCPNCMWVSAFAGDDQPGLSTSAAASRVIVTVLAFSLCICSVSLPRQFWSCIFFYFYRAQHSLHYVDKLCRCSVLLCAGRPCVRCPSVAFNRRSLLSSLKGIFFQILPAWTILILYYTHTSSANEDWACLVTSPDFEVTYRQTRSFESVPRRGMATGPRRSGDVPVVDHPPSGSTRSVVTRVLQRLRPCS